MDSVSSKAVPSERACLPLAGVVDASRSSAGWWSIYLKSMRRSWSSKCTNGKGVKEAGRWWEVVFKYTLSQAWMSAYGSWLEFLSSVCASGFWPTFCIRLNLFVVSVCRTKMHPIKPIKKQLSIVDLSLWLMMFSPKVSSPYVNLMSQQIRQAASQANSNMYLNSKGMLIQTVLGLPRYTKSLSNSLLSHLRLGRFQEGLWATRLHDFFLHLQLGTWKPDQTTNCNMGNVMNGYIGYRWYSNTRLQSMDYWQALIYIYIFIICYISITLKKGVSIRQPMQVLFCHMFFVFSGQTCDVDA